jgi:hypothetical protein
METVGQYMASYDVRHVLHHMSDSRYSSYMASVDARHVLYHNAQSGPRCLSYATSPNARHVNIVA